MKSNATKEYYFTADWYGYKKKTGAEGVEYTEYTQVPQEVAITLAVNITGDLVIDSETKMQINSYLKNLRDRAGDEIYTDGEWQIVQTQPLIDPMGYKDGYRYRAKIIAGDI
ncbi:hypothetical protein UFOVP1212_4 [uncultured Caudovirales phage]|uniref:Uncharacterized protein n=1 Tax=uncultured Caudovirales phage TaxID=2100421 RepID=A0A6J5R266_9CAUD|nr:hypothetical protein UFOVP1212_4 [uncultured Caudovirales phage]